MTALCNGNSVNVWYICYWCRRSACDTHGHHSQFAGEMYCFDFILSNQRRRIITEWWLIIAPAHSNVWTEDNLTKSMCTNIFYFVEHFMPWTHRGWAPAAVAHFSWCWQSEPHGEEQAEEAKTTRDHQRLKHNQTLKFDCSNLLCNHKRLLIITCSYH